jgi:hypothetical protein
VEADNKTSKKENVKLLLLCSLCSLIFGAIGAFLVTLLIKLGVL